MDNRMNILQKALQLFYEKGYDAIGVQEIADAAGVTKPTLYHYFGLAVRAEYAGDLPMNLERLTKFYLDFCSSHEAYYKLMMAMMYSAKESDTYKVIYPCMQEIIRMLTDMFLKAGDIIGNMRGRQEQYSIGFFGMLNNYMLYWFGRDAESRPELSEGQAHELVHQFLYGIYV